MKHEDITKRIIGAALTVHNALRNGYPEVHYQRAMAIEMPYFNLNFKREFTIPVKYKGHLIGTRRVDFYVENCVMVELKALIKMEDIHLAQAINYLEAYDMEIGLLINFGARSLEFKRVHNNKKR